MTRHSSATARSETPHANRTTRAATVINALKLRAQAVLKDESIDARSRAIIRYGLETNDPWLAELVRVRMQTKTLPVLSTSRKNRKLTNMAQVEKIEALAEIIGRGGDKSAGALFVDGSA